MLWPRFLALRAIRSLGYEVRRVASPAELEVEASSTDPVTIEYCLSKRGYAVFDVPVRHARAFHAMGLPVEPQTNPFSRAFERALQSSEAATSRETIDRELRSYYTLVQPKSALEVVELSALEAPGMAGEPSFNYLVPWWEKGVAETVAGRERALRYVGMRYGTGIAANKGHPFFGPLQDSRFNLQVERLDRLLQAVRREGFKPFARDFPIKVTALRKQDEYRWFIEEGQHRFALAGASAVESIPAIVVSIVRREDARLWPQVVGGVFSESGATKIFDRIFAGRPPVICQRWMEN